MNGRKARVRRWTWSFTQHARLSGEVLCTATHHSLLPGESCGRCRATV